MFTPIKILALIGTLATTAFAQQSPIPASVLVGTDEVKAKEFTTWTETDVSKYAGTFSGDVGGDSTGKLTFRIAKAKKDESPVLASGTYSVTPAGMAPTVVTFENALYWGDPEGFVSVGAFNLVFVKFGKTRGVVVGNVFVPKA